MLKIGDFAKLAQVTVKTLHHYDELGLIKPLEVDAMTGYRYYSATQLQRMNQIIALKILGLSLEHIRSILENDLSSEELGGILKLRRTELEMQLRDTESQLVEVTERLEGLARHEPHYDVVVKSVPSQLVATTRQEVSDFDSLRPTLNSLFGELFRFLKAQGQSYANLFVLYHNQPSQLIVEAGVRLEHPIRSEGSINVYELPTLAKAATVIHQGSYGTLAGAYQSLGRWLESHALETTGPTRELYLHYESRNSKHHVTEIQMPIPDG